MRVSSNKVFFSAQSTEVGSVDNDSRHAKVLDILRRESVTFTVMTGVYKGNAERSIMLYSNSAKEHEANLALAIDLALMFNQESVLEVANDGAAFLHVPGSGIFKSVGHFAEVDRETALAKESYTYDEATNRYYIAE